MPAWASAARRTSARPGRAVLRVFIADDSLGFGTLAAAWLESYDDMDVVGTARSAPEAIAALTAAAPDVVILDRLLPQPEHSEEVLAHVPPSCPPRPCSWSPACPTRISPARPAPRGPTAT